MGDSGDTTQVFDSLIDRLNRGDSSAREELLHHSSRRLEHLVRKKLRGFAQVRRWEETTDVLQQVLIRLCRALEQVQFKDAKHFFALSSSLIRRELIDLKRHYYGAEGGGAHHATDVYNPADTGPGAAAGAGTDTLDPSRLAEWTEFHRQVEALPPELKEVVDLVWYQGLEQQEAATLLGVSSKTVSRRWREARLTLGASLAE